MGRTHGLSASKADGRVWLKRGQARCAMMEVVAPPRVSRSARIRNPCGDRGGELWAHQGFASIDSETHTEKETIDVDQVGFSPASECLNFASSRLHVCSFARWTLSTAKYLVDAEAFPTRDRSLNVDPMIMLQGGRPD